ncbi:hypothetical protein ACVILK_003241 [Bradyrhizobium embrapense]
MQRVETAAKARWLHRGRDQTSISDAIVAARLGRRHEPTAALCKISCRPGMQPRRIEHWQLCMFGTDEKTNLRAAKDERVGAPGTTSRNDINHFLARVIRDRAAAQLIENDIVDPAPLVLRRYDRRKAEPLPQALTIERLLHRIACPEQEWPRDESGKQSRSGHIDDVDERHTQLGSNDVGNHMHRIGADQDVAGACIDLLPGDPRQMSSGLPPFSRLLKGDDIGEVNRAKQDVCRGQTAAAPTDDFIDFLVIDGCAFPAHPSDQPDGSLHFTIST